MALLCLMYPPLSLSGSNLKAAPPSLPSFHLISGTSHRARNSGMDGLFWTAGQQAVELLLLGRAHFFELCNL